MVENIAKNIAKRIGNTTHESYSPEREAKIYRYFEQLALENGEQGIQRYDLGVVAKDYNILKHYKTTGGNNGLHDLHIRIWWR